MASTYILAAKSKTGPATMPQDCLWPTRRADHLHIFMYMYI